MGQGILDIPDVLTYKTPKEIVSIKCGIFLSPTAYAVWTECHSRKFYSFVNSIINSPFIINYLTCVLPQIVTQIVTTTRDLVFKRTDKECWTTPKLCIPQRRGWGSTLQSCDLPANFTMADAGSPLGRLFCHYHQGSRVAEVCLLAGWVTTWEENNQIRVHVLSEMEKIVLFSSKHWKILFLKNQTPFTQYRVRSHTVVPPSGTRTPPLSREKEIICFARERAGRLGVLWLFNCAESLLSFIILYYIYLICSTLNIV